MTEHNHDHDHEGHEHITLVDEQGNETLYEILLTVDGQIGRASCRERV